MRELDKELFYTLENVQVDVLNCTQEEINAVIDIYRLNNVKYVKRDYKGGNDSHSFLMSYNNSTNEYPIITYSKFMELFGETQYEVKYIAEQPKKETVLQPHYDNTNGSIYKFCKIHV